MFKKTIILFVLTGLFAVSCSKYQKLLKSTDYEEKFQMAFVYYQQGDYHRAIQLFDQIIPYFRGTDRAENISYHYAYAHYKQKDYILASFYFKRFTTTFPRSEHVEELTFMSAYCKYLDSPTHSLDQTSTMEAIQELQIFINKYPESSRVDEANQLIDNLRSKLEKKAMEIARLYFNMESYNSAITALNNVLKDFPDTGFREEILFLILKANYDFASKSIEDRRQQRYNETLEAYNVFISHYPESTYSREAGQIYRNTMRHLNLTAN